MIGPEIAGPVGAATKGKTTEAHVEAMWDNVRAAFMLPMINLAYRTGLFAAMAHAGPLTIAQVAERSKYARPGRLPALVALRLTASPLSPPIVPASS